MITRCPSEQIGSLDKPVDVTVSVAGVKSNPITDTFLGVPTSASLTPDHGPISGGTLVTVTGTGFVPSATTITIGGSVLR